MRASARERAHTGTLTSRSVENVKRSGPRRGWRRRFIGLGSPSAENPCIAARLGLKLRRGWGAVRHAPGVGGGRLRTNPLNLAGLAR